MTQSAPRTFSPSSLRMTRSTPWVDGCCGPMLRTSSVESRNVASGILVSLTAFDTQVFLNPAIVLLEDTVILAQRVTLPFLWQEDAAHVRMACELDAEHVEHFALQPIGGEVHVDRGLGLVLLGDESFDAHALIASEAIQNVDDVEAVGALGPIDRGDVDEVIEVGL